ncbi:MAG: hypothetical protein ACYDEY_11275 [Acidimicrobiales bacterium]
MLISAAMLTDAVGHLRDADVTVSRLARERQGSYAAVDPLVEIAAGGRAVRFVVEEKQRAPYPNEFQRLDNHRRTLERLGRPLLVVPYVPIPLGRALIEAGWSWADGQGNYDIRGPGLRLRQRGTASAPKPTRRLLPTGSGSWAIITSYTTGWDMTRAEARMIGVG